MRALTRVPLFQRPRLVLGFNPPSPRPPSEGRGVGGIPSDALQRKGPQRRPQQRLDRRLQEVVKAVGGGYCQLQRPLKLALAVREAVAGHRLGALEGGGGTPPPPPMHPWAYP